MALNHERMRLRGREAEIAFTKPKKRWDKSQAAKPASGVRTLSPEEKAAWAAKNGFGLAR